MNKKLLITRKSKIQLIGCQAKPGAALSFLKNMVVFCKSFNDKTVNIKGEKVSVEITVYANGTYDYIIGNPPISYLIKKIGKNIENFDDNDFNLIISQAESSFNSYDREKRIQIIKGTARSFNKK